MADAGASGRTPLPGASTRLIQITLGFRVASPAQRGIAEARRGHVTLKKTYASRVAWAECCQLLHDVPFLRLISPGQSFARVSGYTPIVRAATDLAPAPRNRHGPAA